MAVDYLLQENGDQIILESGLGHLILEQSADVGVQIAGQEHSRQVIGPAIDARGWGEDRQTGPIFTEEESLIHTTARIMRIESLLTQGRIQRMQGVLTQGRILKEEYKKTTAKILKENYVNLYGSPNDADKKLMKRINYEKIKGDEMTEALQDRKKQILKDALKEFLKDE